MKNLAYVFETEVYFMKKIGLLFRAKINNEYFDVITESFSSEN